MDKFAEMICFVVVCH